MGTRSTHRSSWGPGGAASGLRSPSVSNVDAPPGDNRLRALLERREPLLAVSFTDADTDAELSEACELGLDVAELRIDRFDVVDTAHVLAVCDRLAASCPDAATLATIRSSEEGGDWSGTDTARAELFGALLDHVHGVDVELSSEALLESLGPAAADRGTVLVISHHDFDRTPPSEQLVDIVERAVAAGADVVKISTMATERSDVRRLAALTLAPCPVPLVVIAMGELGSISRLCLPALGSAITYAARGRSSAPGQLDHAEQVDLMARFGMR